MIGTRGWKTVWLFLPAGGSLADIVTDWRCDGMVAFRVVALSLLCAFPAIAADLPVPSNPEMAAIFKADQADRMHEPIDWKVVKPADDKRLARTKQLLDAGELRSGDDFYDAAFIFQHGDTPNDYLKAHLLATVAAAKGQPDAPWIAAASLDRYLQRTGKPQVLGTQFSGGADGKYTQEPYDRTFASDAVRKAMQVPPLAEQEAQRREYEAEAKRSQTSNVQPADHKVPTFIPHHTMPNKGAPSLPTTTVGNH